MTDKRKKFLKTVVTIAFVGMLMVLAFHRRTVRVEHYRLGYMGTGTHIIVFAQTEKQGQEYIALAEDEIGRIDAMMDYHDPNSFLNKINMNAFDRPVKVSDELMGIFIKSLEYYEMSGGKFDVTVGVLKDLWANTENIPDIEQFKEAMDKVGSNNFIVDRENKTVSFKVKGMKVDLGGIAKGYAIDRAVDVLKQAGAKGGMVDIGGDLRCFGFSPASGGYIVGLQNPAAVEDVNEPGLLTKFAIEDMAVATSGDYRRYVEIDGERISHIIDPCNKAGTGRYSSVTVIGEKAIDADALATTVSLMEPGDGLEIIEELENIEAVLVTKEGEIVKSSGVEEFIKR